jgi:hypothetical protein
MLRATACSGSIDGKPGGSTMRLTRLVPAAAILLSPWVASAQGLQWTQYVSKEDFFSISFPGTPKVESTTFETEYRITLPARIHAYVTPDKRLFQVTVVDYRDAVKMHLARNEACAKAGGDGDQCQDEGPKEMRGALVWASWGFMQRPNTKLTHYAHYNSDLIEGHELHLTNPDGSLTHAAVHMHEDRLYIIEATVPKGFPPPNLFQISVRFLDSKWQPVRYSWNGTQLYSNGYPPPPRSGGGQNQGQQQQYGGDQGQAR